MPAVNSPTRGFANVVYLAALQVLVMSKEMVDNWVRYRVLVEHVFKRGVRGRRGETYLWMSPRLVHCKCPKIRTGRRYILLGKELASER